MARSVKGLNRKRWQVVRQRVLNRDGWRCVCCGKAGRLEVDHIVPIAQGGDPWDMGNLQTLARGCHIEKTRRENTTQAAKQYPLANQWKIYWKELLQ